VEKALIKRVLRRCILCNKIEGKLFATPERLRFCCLVADGEDLYVCLYTCASTRGVHLEMLRHLSTDMFLQSFLLSYAHNTLFNNNVIKL
jgi:hypothetical protein